ncbi:MAG: hypothetical protein J6R41_00425 [Paludibacteraceae bacterium]|nr:hypothetical protein [Paludibacteraceae bacterium]
MKTLRLIGTVLAFITFGFGFSSCDDDDEKDDFPIELIGKWLYESEEYRELLTFKSDGSVTSNGAEPDLAWDVEGHFTCDGDHISLIFEDEDNSFGTYKVTETTFTITIDGVEFIYIKKPDDYVFEK